MTPAIMAALGRKGVKTLDDVADLASDELLEYVGSTELDETLANEVIMAARAHWFEGEESGEAGANPGASS
jgi:N utilization substance protein A